MKKSSLLPFFCLTLLSLTHLNIAYSQVTNINYVGSGLSTTACNVFASLPYVGGLLHLSMDGGVTYNPATGISLATTPHSDGGTAYVIDAGFAPGNTYSISITAQGDGAVQLETSVVADLSKFSKTGTTSCTPDNAAWNYTTTGYAQMVATPTAAGGIYTAPQFTVAGSTTYPYLVVWATGGSTSLSEDALVISKIVITEVAGPSFSISPATVPVTCGSSTPVTFTVNAQNYNGTPSSYSWNLGSANNGWLYGGVAAGQTINTTTNTLTLTPVCGGVQNSLTAVVAAGGKNYNTNTSSVSVTQPSMSISGNSPLCTSGNYTINGVPCNSSVTWSLSPSGIANLSTTTTNGVNPTTITASSSGVVTLAANVTACGTTTPLSESLHVGHYTSSDFSITGNNGSIYYCYNQTITLGVSGNGSNYVWTLPTGWSAISPPGNSYLQFKTSAASGPTGTVSVSLTEACGNPVTVNKFMAYSSSACTVPYSLSPNPASSYVNIQGTGSPQAIVNTVQITDVNGNVYVNNQYSSTNTSAYVTITSVPNGTAFAKIYNGSQWYSIQFVVQH